MRRLWHAVVMIGVIVAAIALEYAVRPDAEPVGQEAAQKDFQESPAALRVIDGDSFHWGAREIRLHAIDAPEGKQMCAEANGTPWPCGSAAHMALKAILSGGGLACTPVAEDRYGRQVARCRTDAVPDVGELMVHQGMAVALTLSHKTPYDAVEARARVAKRGLWRGTFERPSDWRNRPVP